jgi:hypothetical protein
MVRHERGPDAAGHARLLLGEYGSQLAFEIARFNASACRDRYWANVFAEMQAHIAVAAVATQPASADRLPSAAARAADPSYDWAT